MLRQQRKNEQFSHLERAQGKMDEVSSVAGGSFDRFVDNYGEDDLMDPEQRDQHERCSE